jgi:hypothetical protein
MQPRKQQITEKNISHEQFYYKQAGAELCQAQVKLGRVNNPLPIYPKIMFPLIWRRRRKTFKVVFYLPNKLRPSSIFLQIEIIFHFP